MKKLIGIFAILLIATGVFGQKSVRKFSYIERTPTGNNTVEDAINRTNTQFVDYNWISYVHFISNERLFLLSFEPVSNNDRLLGCDRNVYLYSKDTSNAHSKWEKASKVVITGNYVDHKNEIDIDFKRSDMSRGSVGTVNVLDNGNVEMTIGLEVRKYGKQMPNEVLKFTFIPKSTNFYSVRKWKM